MNAGDTIQPIMVTNCAGGRGRLGEGGLKTCNNRNLLSQRLEARSPAEGRAGCSRVSSRLCRFPASRGICFLGWQPLTHLQSQKEFDEVFAWDVSPFNCGRSVGCVMIFHCGFFFF